MYIDFFLVLAMSHMKCKQHKASHNILTAGPEPMRPRGPCKTKCPCTRSHILSQAPGPAPTSGWIDTARTHHKCLRI